MKPTVRAFIAVEATKTIRANCEKLMRQLQRTTADVKWVEPENLHLTLKFLGDVHLNETPRICEVVRQAVEPLAPFSIEMVGAGAFPSAHRPRTVWLGAGEGADKMESLFDVLEDRLAKQFHFRKDARRFHPHLTLGRVRGGGSGMADLTERIEAASKFEAGSMVVRELVVFSSILERSGPIYEPLGRARLAGG